MIEDRVTEDEEQPLHGGAQTAGLVRVGATVRRPATAGSGRTRALLRHLEQVGFPGAPRALGVDEKGRDVLTFVEGEVPQGPPYRLSDAQLVSAARLIAAYHDATATSGLRADQEVVCHGDLGPHNTVFRGDVAVALIDWDDGVGPGRRADDLAHAAWCFADLTEDAVPVEEQARKLRLLCQVWPGMTPQVVVRELHARFGRARSAHARAGRSAGVEVFDRLLRWLDEHGPELSAADR